MMVYHHDRFNELFLAVENLVKEWVEKTPQTPRGIKAPPSYVYQEVSDYLNNIAGDLRHSEKGRR
jgi:hypothetical protein